MYHIKKRLSSPMQASGLSPQICNHYISGKERRGQDRKIQYGFFRMEKAEERRKN